MNERLIEMARRVNLKDIIINQQYPYINGRDHIKISCVFHKERTPSLAIYENSFYCFGCQEGGSTIDWIMKVHDKSFLDAVKILLNYDKKHD